MNQLATNNTAQITQLVTTNADLASKITQLEATRTAYQPPHNVTATKYNAPIATVSKKSSDQSDKLSRRMNLGNIKVFSTMDLEKSYRQTQRCDQTEIKIFVIKHNNHHNTKRLLPMAFNKKKQHERLFNMQINQHRTPQQFANTAYLMIIHKISLFFVSFISFPHILRENKKICLNWIRTTFVS